MVIYSIFYKENEKYYPIWMDDNDRFWLGGSRLNPIITKTKYQAESIAKKIKNQEIPFFENGRIIVKRAKIEVV